MDGSEGMCRVASSNLGSEVRRLDFLELDYEDEFDGVWACASLLHLKADEVPVVLGLIRRALRVGGVVYVSFKEGTFEGFRDGRWYTDMTVDGLVRMAGDAGLPAEDVWLNTDPRGTVWVNAMLVNVRSGS